MQCRKWRFECFSAASCTKIFRWSSIGEIVRLPRYDGNYDENNEANKIRKVLKGFCIYERHCFAAYNLKWFLFRYFRRKKSHLLRFGIFTITLALLTITFEQHSSGWSVETEQSKKPLQFSPCIPILKRNTAKKVERQANWNTAIEEQLETQRS